MFDRKAAENRGFLRQISQAAKPLRQSRITVMSSPSKKYDLDLSVATQSAQEGDGLSRSKLTETNRQPLTVVKPSFSAVFLPNFLLNNRRPGCQLSGLKCGKLGNDMLQWFTSSRLKTDKIMGKWSQQYPEFTYISTISR
jgi:hypothetical protein